MADGLVKIGNVSFNGRFVLAPMAGVTDSSFRTICKEHGAAATYTEMVSAKALVYKDKKTAGLLQISDGERPCAAQIFGSDPDIMAEAADLVLSVSNADFIDINMGCPVHKIAGNGDGCALMRDIKKAEKIIGKVSAKVKTPVTVKFRLGWNEEEKNAVEFAKMAESAGAAAVCVHGRTRAQLYSGKANWEELYKIRNAVKNIPFIANGDVNTPQDALDILSKTGADVAMIGRGAMGNPFIFDMANALYSGEEPKTPTYEERIREARKHMELAVSRRGEKVAMLEARRHVNWYLKGMPGTKKLKERICRLSSFEELSEVLSQLENEMMEGR